MNYRPTSRPGCRAPHIWLEDGRSMLDLFGRGFVLLEFGVGAAGASGGTAAGKAVPGAAAQCFSACAEGLGIPLKVINIQQADAIALYEQRYVLVRPDGHVAWRGNQIPGDISGLLATVTGQKKGLTNEAIPI
jgi:hypothetical protein